MGVPNRFFLLRVRRQSGLMKIHGEVSSAFYFAFSLPLSSKYLGIMMNAEVSAPGHFPFISSCGVLDCGAGVNGALVSGAYLSSHKLIGTAADWAKTSV
jgi:hypothetical protein